MTTPRRVQIPAHTDAWMSGDRFGTVQNTYVFRGIDRVAVEMDKSHRVLRFPLSLVTFVR